MGIYSGSFGITRYYIAGSMPRRSRADLSELLHAFKARPLKLDGPVKADSVGWVRPLTESDAAEVSDDSPWDLSDCMTDAGYLLRLRSEQRKVPMTLFQTLFRAELREYLQEHGKVMPRAERQELRKSIMHDLLKKTLPHLRFTDLLWRPDAGELLVFSTSKKARLDAEELMRQTFLSPLGLTLWPRDLSSSLFDDSDLNQDESRKRLDRLSHIHQVAFVASPAEI